MSCASASNTSTSRAPPRTVAGRGGAGVPSGSRTNVWWSQRHLFTSVGCGRDRKYVTDVPPMFSVMFGEEHVVVVVDQLLTVQPRDVHAHLLIELAARLNDRRANVVHPALEVESFSIPTVAICCHCESVIISLSE